MTGEIKAVTGENVTVKTSASNNANITKANLDRIVIGSNPRRADLQRQIALTTVYSGRSSWSDIVELGSFAQKVPSHKIRVRLSMKDGTAHEGDLRSATESEVQLSTSGNEISISRSDIQRAEFIREKPISSGGEYWWSEAIGLQFFDPELYPRMFHLGDTMQVRLYDSSLPQADSAVRCQ